MNFFNTMFSATPINRDSLNPYSLQNHARLSVPTMHNENIVQSVTNAPPLQRIAPNPSGFSIKNIVRGQYFPPIRLR